MVHKVENVYYLSFLRKSLLIPGLDIIKAPSKLHILS